MNFSLMPNFGLYNLQNPEEKYAKQETSKLFFLLLCSGATR